MKSNDRLFDKLISSIQNKRALMKELIEARRKTAVAEAEDLQMQLKEEIAKLRRRDADVEQVSHTADHIHFIQVKVVCSRPTCFSFYNFHLIHILLFQFSINQASIAARHKY